MTFSYNNALTDDLDRVRFLLADTVDAGHVFEDEEIEALLATAADPVAVAITCCYARAARLSTQVDVTIGRTSEKGSQLATAWLNLAKRLQEAGGSMLPGYAGEMGGWTGGASIAEAEALAANTDNIPGAFGVGMHDFPGSGMRGSLTDED